MKPPLPHHIDSTMMACFRSCPQKFYREFVQGYRPPGLSIDLHAGGCFSSAVEETRLQVWNNGKSLEDALLLARARFFVQWGDVEAPEWKVTAKTKDRVWEAVEGYFATWSPLTDHVRPYATRRGPTLEYTFALPLEPMSTHASDDRYAFPLHPDGGPFLFCGRFDLLGEYLGRPCIEDDKTTGSITRNWAESWNLRSQFLGYVWACQQDGMDLDTVIVRGIGILKEKLNYVEAIKVYSKHLVSLWFEQLRRDLWRMRRAYDEDYFDYNLAETCTTYGLCPFLDSCASSNPEAWLQDFDIRHWNPLLKTPVKMDGTARTY